jgi:IS1 family transposase
MTQKYDSQLAHLKNKTEESARAITLASKRVTATESKFTQKLKGLDRRTQIVTRSASS